MAIALGIGAAAAAVIWSRLRPYGMPWDLTAVCILPAAGTIASTVLHLAEVFSATTHRCTAPGCRFRIRTTGVDAAERRRWQEAAAAHPDHRLPRSV
ncbi:hypothetical protein GO001_12075 [Streptomyces sp. NRRL B-1677]|uniref:hypothetical protein n=1 Tax=Streptomyces sp. NRRL B-1677 TaxID=2682966 RepID=UPI0018928E29|nr:hypothetical protein [Streptomyces sp. NRRL B-1677]MBF6045957.1 hypothetical protein [Streptomyces sp. NRRL B-1677]